MTLAEARRKGWTIAPSMSRLAKIYGNAKRAVAPYGLRGGATQQAGTLRRIHEEAHRRFRRAKIYVEGA